jgi:hypothetical protein
VSCACSKQGVMFEVNACIRRTCECGLDKPWLDPDSCRGTSTPAGSCQASLACSFFPFLVWQYERIGAQARICQGISSVSLQSLEESRQI